MGSLMAGWSTNPNGPEETLKRCKSSLTKEEVDRLKKMRDRAIQEHVNQAHLDAAQSPTSGMPIPSMLIPKLDIPENEEVTGSSAGSNGGSSLPPSLSSPPWWTTSKWAFLNDPPTTEEKHAKYVPQFDVATRGHMAVDHPTGSAPMV